MDDTFKYAVDGFEHLSSGPPATMQNRLAEQLLCLLLIQRDEQGRYLAGAPAGFEMVRRWATEYVNATERRS